MLAAVRPDSPDQDARQLLTRATPTPAGTEERASSTETRSNAAVRTATPETGVRPFRIHADLTHVRTEEPAPLGTATMVTRARVEADTRVKRVAQKSTPVTQALAATEAPVSLTGMNTRVAVLKAMSATDVKL